MFASSDRDAEAFDGYHKEQPWLAIPYANRDAKNALSKKYKVSGIPSLVIVDAATGELITKDGRSDIIEDPTGERFPWKPKSLADSLAEITTLRGKDGAEVPRSAIEGKTLGLYFSAHWCGPCRGFTPELAKTYTAMQAKGLTDNFEIIFVSSDRDNTAFEDYHAEQPWLALPYAQRDLKAALSKACEVEGIPTLTIVGPDGKIINGNGRSALSKDKDGSNFPWHPPAYTDLEDGESINDSPTFIAFVDGAAAEDAGTPAAAEKAVQQVAEEADRANKEAGKDASVFYTIAKKGDGLAPRIRGITDAPDTPGAKPLLMVVDLQDDKSYYMEEVDTVTVAAVKDFVAKFDSKKLEKKKLNF